jgi:mannose-6-phosphate isomerase-like protein (cupin superfamily)
MMQNMAGSRMPQGRQARRPACLTSRADQERAMSTKPPSTHIPTLIAAASASALPMPPGRLSRLAFDTGEIELRHYAPHISDTQTPHDRDELYFVISGRGQFERADERVAFAPGDVLFAAAGETHRFVDFSDDFATWVLFYGPRKA